ncbi:MAG: DUF3793 family protein [Treponema sp.]|jgi:hypothetical protein|nr:DUF3793 family protein [Treponema sp.]
MEPAGTGEIENAIIRHCSPMLMGCKPAVLFPFDSGKLRRLLGLLPSRIGCQVIREERGRVLLFLFDGAMLEQTIFRSPIRDVLMDMGYPSRLSLPLFLAHLQKQFECRRCPHEVGLFLGYPPDDVSGFIKNRGAGFKLCGPWKVYGDVEKAKDHFREYERCREYMKRYIGKQSGPL